MPLLLFKSPEVGIPTDDLLVRLNIDEGSGQTLADSSGNSNDFQLGSTSGVDTNDPSWTTFGGETILNFDGVDNYCVGATNISLNADKASLVVVFRELVVKSQRLSSHNFGASNFAANISGGSNYNSIIGGSVTSNASFTTSSWVSFITTFGSNRAKNYINGSLSTDDDFTGVSINTAARATYLGVRNVFFDQNLDGDLAYFLLYNRELGNAEVAAIHSAIKAEKPGLGLP